MAPRPGLGGTAAAPAPPPSAPATAADPEAGCSPPAIEVLVADPDPLARRALREAVARGAGAVVVGEAPAADALLELAARVLPDVILVGSRTAGEGLIDLTRLLIARVPGARVVVLATVGDERLALPALRAGAVGFLSRDVSAEALPRIVRGVAAGEAALPRALTGRLAAHVRAAGRRDAASPAALSPRERELVDLLAVGMTPTALAQRLRLPPEAVRSLLRRVMLKLGVRTRSEAIAVARRLHELALAAGAERG